MRKTVFSLAVLLALPPASLAAHELHGAGVAAAGTRLVVFEDFSSPT